MFQDNFLNQFVLENTFNKNILDFIISNDPSRIFCVNVGPPLGKKTDKKSKMNYEQELAQKCKHNPKLLYHYVNRQKTFKDQIVKLIDNNNQVLLDGNKLLIV
ncbi:hypothetical protein BpHYR1_015753 [Brachionus plicatilis]|uniref:Uncharacterized protein n=1 Tax=Brachionus plicatilis TaxID=10195 RepID=A0A3M7PCM9_BRAPC|nr:hypothetical protein BpHYR1_015753 [Brachionus plicatilis]